MASRLGVSPRDGLWAVSQNFLTPLTYLPLHPQLSATFWQPRTCMCVHVLRGRFDPQLN